MSPRTAAPANDYAAAVAATLRAERGAAGLTMEQLAARSGIVRITLHRVLHSQRAMTVAQLAALAAVFDMTPSELLTEAERRSARDSVGGAAKLTPTERRAGP